MRASGLSRYDREVLADAPVGLWGLDGTGTDLSGHGHEASYRGGHVEDARLPDGERASRFDGSTGYVTIPSAPEFSIPTTGALTWEAWIRRDVLQSPHGNDGYVAFLGKCADYAPTCEWEGRMYDERSRHARPSRISAYAFNSSAGLGSGASWQPVPGLIGAGRWLHVVAEYQTLLTPPDCPADPPGTIRIWVDAIPAAESVHRPTGCMAQFGVVPRAGTSPVTVATMAKDSWFPGAIAKVAVYDHLLPPSRITSHYEAMTGAAPQGGCREECTLATDGGIGRR